MTSTSSFPTYRLILVQEPTIGSAFEENVLGRIGLAPPLILELELTKDGKVEDASAELPFLICQCSLLNEQGDAADMVSQAAAMPSSAGSTLMPPTPSRRRGRRSSSNRRRSSPSGPSSRSSGSTDVSVRDSSSAPASISGTPALARMLYGTIVAGAQPFTSLREEEGEKPYFFFPELSVRTPGKFKIQCRLMRLAL